VVLQVANIGDVDPSYHHRLQRQDRAAVAPLFYNQGIDMSFDIALSGIQAINEQLETVSNNIANASTYGFKSSRANFSSVYAGARPTAWRSAR
jgi:hypothetical protein